MKEKTGIQYLNRINKELIHTEEVKRVGQSGNKDKDLNNYMERLKKMEEIAIESQIMDILKHFYYQRYIIKVEDIPQKNKDNADIIIKNQKETLDVLIDYIQTTNYPTWYKYFIFQGIVGIGTLIKKEDGTYLRATKRTSKTINPFIEFNISIIEKIYAALISLLNDQQLKNNELENLIKNGNFSKIYIYLLNRKIITNPNFQNSEGIWKKYPMRSNPRILYNDLHDKETLWCTALNYQICKDHIFCGDFYVYYTKDKKNHYTIPRIAIRMIGTNQIEEVRGIANDQNLESSMIQIASDKIHEIVGKAYETEKNDMQTLNIIYKKHINDVPLTIEDIIFIYEINKQIRSFGYKKDKRIEIIKKSRNQQNDYNEIFNIFESYPKNLTLNLTKLDDIKFPKIIDGDLDISAAKTIENTIFPEIIKGTLYLNTSSIKSCRLPKKIYRLNLSSDSIDDLDLSNIEIEEIIMPKMKSLSNIKFPQHINEVLNLNSVENIENFVFPKYVGNLYLQNLKKISKVQFPTKISGNLELGMLTKFDYLKLPEIVIGNLNLKNILSLENVKLPKVVKGILQLNNIEEIPQLPEILGGIILTNVKKCNLKFPNIMNGNIELSSIESPFGLSLPIILKGNLFLSKLKFSGNLKLPEQIDGYLYLNSLEEPIKLPKIVNKDIYLANLKSGNGLILPNQVLGTIYLNSLEDIKEMIIPEELNCKIICPKFNNDLNYMREYIKKNNTF